MEAILDLVTFLLDSFVVFIKVPDENSIFGSDIPQG